MAEALRREGRTGERFDPGQDFVGAQRLCRTGRDLDQEVEVVGEDAEGEHADPAEAFVFPEQAHELFALLRTEDEVAVHDARHAVVVGDGEGGGSLQTALAHGGSIAAHCGIPPSPDLPIGVLSLLVL